MPEVYLVNYDAVSGEIEGLYCREIHGENIPEPNIEIDMATWQKLLSEQGRWKINVSTKELLYIDPPAPTPEEVKKQIAASYQPTFDALAVCFNRANCDSNTEAAKNIQTTYQTVKAQMQKEIENLEAATVPPPIPHYCNVCGTVMTEKSPGYWVCPRCGNIN